jgi:hypothetical protein
MSTTNYYFTSKYLSPASTGSASERFRRLSLSKPIYQKPSAIPIAEAVIIKYIQHLGQKKLQVLAIRLIKLYEYSYLCQLYFRRLSPSTAAQEPPVEVGYY